MEWKMKFVSWNNNVGMSVIKKMRGNAISPWGCSVIWRLERNYSGPTIYNRKKRMQSNQKYVNLS